MNYLPDNRKKVIVIGSGFSGLSAAAYLAAAGHDVQVFEKNDMPGGRARQLRTQNGYVFDMGPSWYWMPDVFERFFADFGHSSADFYKLKLLDPSFDIVFANKQTLSVPDAFEELCQLFESIEKGSAAKLETFMQEAKYKYEIGMENLVYMPGLSVSEFVNIRFLTGALRLQVFTSLSKHVRKFFTDPRLITLMEFPVLFLGAMPQDIPALYSLMNYASLKLGTWYPLGGFGKVVEAVMKVAEKKGARFHFNTSVDQIVVNKERLAESVIVNGRSISCDAVIAAADYYYVENELLPRSYRNYSKSYWEKKTLAPSCLIYYVGLKRRIRSITHHTLFFEEDLLQHSIEIYKSPQWPSKPLFYVCCPSQSDSTVAPDGHENLFLLMPLAPGLEDNEEMREKYFRIMLERLQQHIGETISGSIDFKQSYCIKDFKDDYHSYKGNAYGLANTLRQTAFLKPKIRNKKINNLFYAGQLTVPGPGVPPSLISGKIAAEQLTKFFKCKEHEISV